MGALREKTSRKEEKDTVTDRSREERIAETDKERTR
jgi:hypothetical protein